MALGDLAGAGEAYERGLAVAPTDAGLLAARAEWLEWRGAYEDGLAALGDAADDPGIDLVRARLLRRLGRGREETAARVAAGAAAVTAIVARNEGAAGGGNASVTASPSNSGGTMYPSASSA